MKHNIWSIIFEDLKWTPIFSLIVSKCLENNFFIVEDHMYIVILLHKWRGTLSTPSCKIISQDLVGPSPITANTPFKSKNKWYSLTFNSPINFSGNRNVVVISCNPYSICGQYVNVSSRLKNSMQTTSSYSLIIKFSNDGDGHWIYDFTKCMHSEQNLHIEKINKIILANHGLLWTFNDIEQIFMANPWLFWTLKYIRQIFVMAWNSHS